MLILLYATDSTKSKDVERRGRKDDTRNMSHVLTVLNLASWQPPGGRAVCPASQLPWLKPPNGSDVSNVALLEVNIR